MTRRLAAIVFAAALLTGCGFHLRNALNLPENLGPVRVVAGDPYSALADNLAEGLQTAGAQAAPAGAETGVATLRIVSEQWADTPISHDQFGRAQEFSLRYAVIFSMQRADGSVVVPQQVVEIARSYVTVPDNNIGSDSEQEILAKEMQRDMVASIMRRIDAALQATGPVGDATPEAPAEESAPPHAP